MRITDGMFLDSCVSVLQNCLCTAKHENVLVIFDKFGLQIAEAFSSAALQADSDICFRFISFEEQKLSSSTDKYLNKVTQCIGSTDALIFSVTDADECTRFRAKILKSAVENMSKIIHMPGVDKQMFTRSTHGLNFKKLDVSAQRLEEKLYGKEEIEIQTRTVEGTEYVLKMSIKGRKTHISGGTAQTGEILNIPTGEVYIAPIENTGQGSLVLNGSAPNCLFNPPEEVILKFEDGVLDIGKSIFPDEPDSNRFRKEILIPAVEKGISNITLGEFGIGLNSAFKAITGQVVMDEKVEGTAHIALGVNTMFGGNVDGQFHHDLIFIPTSVKINNKLLDVNWRRPKMDNSNKPV